MGRFFVFERVVDIQPDILVHVDRISTKTMKLSHVHHMEVESAPFNRTIWDPRVMVINLVTNKVY